MLLYPLPVVGSTPEPDASEFGDADYCREALPRLDVESAAEPDELDAGDAAPL